MNETTPLQNEDDVRTLGHDEALLFVVPSRSHTYLWAVTRAEIRWLKIAVGLSSLADHVKALRCGLDAVGEWQGDGARLCGKLLGSLTYPGDAAPLPFDLVRAHTLYQIRSEARRVGNTR